MSVYFYRFHASRDGEDQLNDYPTSVFLTAYPVIRETELTVVLKTGPKERRVSKNARRSFAHATPEKALEAFYFRKRVSIQYLDFRLGKERAALEQAQAMRNGTLPIPKVNYR